MALNEKIAEVIWPDRHFPYGYHEFDPVEHAKLLRKRVMAAGWNIQLTFEPGKVKYTALKWTKHSIKGDALVELARELLSFDGEVQGEDEEPAIVELFCRVFGIFEKE